MHNIEPLPRLHRRQLTPCFAKLDGLGWTCGFSVKCFGVRIAVRTNDPHLLEMLRQRVPADSRPYQGKVVDHYLSAVLGGPVQGSRTRRFHLLYHNHTRFYRGHDLDQLLNSFEIIMRFVVAAMSPRHTFVHAGVVGWKGRAILLPGKTFAGKTTLTAELVRAGASYLSDEYAVLDDAGRVHPFLKPLSLRVGPESRQVDTSVEELGGHAAKGPLPVGLVVMSRYREGAGWRPRTLTPGKGALALLANTVNARHVPERVLTDIHKIVVQAPVVKSSRGEAKETAEAILRLLERKCRL